MKTEIEIVYRLFDYEDDFKWKILNYKVVDLVESYKFHIKFTSIRVQTKKYKFLKRGWTPTAVAHDSGRCYGTACLLPPWGTALGP
jgi:hypothetical protein